MPDSLRTRQRVVSDNIIVAHAARTLSASKTPPRHLLARLMPRKATFIAAVRADGEIDFAWRAKRPYGTVMSFLTAQNQDLQRLSNEARLRRLQSRSGTDFSSNDYFTLASAPRLQRAIIAAVERGVPIGSGGSRLLRGNDPEHEALEADAAAFFGSEAALFLSSGYTANVTLFSTLPRRGDQIVHDELIRGSAHEGMRLGRAAHLSTPHNDATAVADAIAG